MNDRCWPRIVQTLPWFQSAHIFKRQQGDEDGPRRLIARLAVSILAPTYEGSDLRDSFRRPVLSQVSIRLANQPKGELTKESQEDLRVHFSIRKKATITEPESSGREFQSASFL